MKSKRNILFLLGISGSNIVHHSQMTHLQDLRFRNSLGLLAVRTAQRSPHWDVLGSLRSHGALTKIRSSE